MKNMICITWIIEKKKGAMCCCFVVASEEKYQKKGKTTIWTLASLSPKLRWGPVASILPGNL